MAGPNAGRDGKAGLKPDRAIRPRRVPDLRNNPLTGRPPTESRVHGPNPPIPLFGDATKE